MHRPRIPLHIIADNIRSVFNVGGILRTADAAGVEQVHLCGYTATTDHKGVLKSSRGAEKLVPVTNWPDARIAVRELKEKGFSIVGLEPGIDSIDYRSMTYHWPLGIVIGNEAMGISPALVSHLDGRVEIPMHGGKSSLNVVVALGIVLFHIVSTPERPEPVIRGAGKPETKVEHVIDCLTDLPFVSDVWIAETPVLMFPFEHVIVISSSRIPNFRMWCAPAGGGIHLVSNPNQNRESSRQKDRLRWRIIKQRSIPSPPNIRLNADLPDQNRSLAYYCLQRIARAEGDRHMGELGLNSVLFDLLRKEDTLVPSIVSMIGRYKASTDHVEKFVHGRYLLDLLLRSHGGAWRSREILLDPPSISRHPLVDSILFSIRNALST